MSRPSARRDAGTSLIALVITISLSLTIGLASMRVIAMSNTEYLRLEQSAQMDEQAAFVIELLARQLQQAGHLDVTQPLPAADTRPPSGALQGFDNAMLAAASPGLAGAVPSGSFGSDVIAVRAIGNASASVRNCAGMPVPVPEGLDDDAGFSALFVSAGPDGQPELKCKYRSLSGWQAQAIASGILAFHCLYGIDSDDDGLPNRFVSASRVAALDASAALDDSPAGPSAWTRIVAVRVALLLRSPQPVERSARRTGFDLFGPGYTASEASVDPGVGIAASALDPYRIHRLYVTTIFLNNSLRPAG